MCFDTRYLGIAKHLVTHATGTAKPAARCASGSCLFKSIRVCSVLNAALTRRWQRSSLPCPRRAPCRRQDINASHCLTDTEMAGLLAPDELHPAAKSEGSSLSLSSTSSPPKTVTTGTSVSGDSVKTGRSRRSSRSHPYLSLSHTNALHSVKTARSRRSSRVSPCLPPNISPYYREREGGRWSRPNISSCYNIMCPHSTHSTIYAPPG
jgi:hypothetical protein